MQTRLPAQIDLILQRRIGLPYLRFTRDDASHDRAEYFAEVAASFCGDRPVDVLDAGCGSAIALRYLLKRGINLRSYTGIDLKAERLNGRFAHLTDRAVFANVDLCQDWSMGTFDVVWCSECLEHIIDDTAVFTKLVAALRPGGILVISVPSLEHRNRIGQRWSWFLETSPVQDGGHVRCGYSVAMLRRLAEGTAARLIRADGITRASPRYIYRRYQTTPMLLPPLYAYTRLLKREGDKYCINPGPDEGAYGEFQSISGVYTMDAIPLGVQ